MPAMRCPEHGFEIYQFCCRHIQLACWHRQAEPLFVQWQPDGDFHLCSACHEAWWDVPAAEREAESGEGYGAFFDSLAVVCPRCLGDWIDAMQIQPVTVRANGERM